MHGQDYTAQRAAWVYMDLHVWTLDAGEDVAKEIAFAVTTALDKTMTVEGGYCDHFRITRAVYPRDPEARRRVQPKINAMIQAWKNKRD